MRYTKLNWLVILLVISLFISSCNLGQEAEPTPDVGAIFTAAAETVQAQFSAQLTQTALAAPIVIQPPTATLIPTLSTDGSPAAPATPADPLATPLASPLPTFGVGTQPAASPLATATPLGGLPAQPTQSCFNSAFIADVTYPDGTVVEDNAWIAKVWSIQNTGTCTWDDGFSLQPVTGDAKGEWVIDEVKEFVEPNEIVEIRIDIKTPSKGGEWGGCWKMMGDNGYYFGTFLCLLVRVE
jgi:hypothetical protein